MGSPTRRELALGRVIDPIRLSAEERLQRFLDTGTELMVSGPAGDFTVQEVVDRSGQSMRSFYQFFDGKYDLMLAVFEDTVRATVGELRTALGDTGPLARLEAFVLGYADRCRIGSPSARVLVDFARTVLTEHPEHATDAYQPLVSLLRELLQAGSEAGVLRAGVDKGSTAAVMVQVLTFHDLTGAITSTEQAGSELWSLFLDGLGVARA